ncbi:hypothetical protein ONZ45_g6719 [Pleurotus djamor]|nr:hypothetical protein ONZ45_g6719 [Pleurotus djamor]
MLSTGQLIWISLRPLLRLFICVGSGFAVTKADLFPPAGARGAGQVILNIALPCLLFSKIVPAFSSDNISVLGALIVVAILHLSIGVLMAWIVKQFFWVPHRFRYGILVAGGWGNNGDIRSAPFIASTDQALSVAYISIFILVNVVALFPCGAHQLVAKDFAGPEIEDEEVRRALRQKHHRWLNLALRPVRQARCADGDISNDLESPITEKQLEDTKITNLTDVPVTTAANELRFESRPDEERPCNALPPTTPHVVCVSTSSDTLPILCCLRRSAIYQHFITFIKSLCTLMSLTIILSILIAVVPQLKGLFVDVHGAGIPPAPDGQPPLAFVIDTATFLGAASVPLGLICLGSALARLKIPRDRWNLLPVGAITSLAFARLLIMPVLGVLICQGLVNVGVIRAEDKVLRFVCIYISCIPTATTQVYLTQVYSGTGDAEHMSAFLIPQFIIMFAPMISVTAYTLRMLF